MIVLFYRSLPHSLTGPATGPSFFERQSSLLVVVAGFLARSGLLRKNEPRRCSGARTTPGKVWVVKEGGRPLYSVYVLPMFYLCSIYVPSTFRKNSTPFRPRRQQRIFCFLRKSILGQSTAREKASKSEKVEVVWKPQNRFHPNHTIHLALCTLCSAPDKTAVK